MIQKKRILVMKFKRSIVVFIAIISLLALTACLGSNGEQNMDNNSTNVETEPNKTEPESESESHEDMNHSGSGEVPAGLKSAENPTYEVGSKVIIKTDHMKGKIGRASCREREESSGGE